ncbi:MULTISPECIES: tRNA (adenosine(37)-N6)-threonylcarbamoyltransferase complex ATPase subunit type 1 TsaE [Treponema]|jgi:tRNA threonylcarbamoyladenosine biosynthesis protein TsaE|uniref:tRNA threonylcarbamoyladenosine biosynthesis protein TsaE n=1 Tax=Treponema rectale TaxID=744512 RepID=A0A840SCD4_9SPIR|nr:MULTISPECIES: tRNA (adenosine(37)-N6)-threonylcarbamoyltransferase complex ATPase subunit type 1 TsaE [Treponema]MBB5218504.1 tRNA threonylcarbamoyladenosine biosynthesis protein TsaE [Treponema rectale]MBE6354127.1 tRNA (adenosine(37)-N6)-threonylcarbamoyltransferase complex ATPase subunit type 1 TsaE [Treponema sp.]MBO6176416.1 tRNA (adenosine(37)-N6)-threonylcarbamoyltransferase complex ATPase subunit type 1 TsaE [Treponema sp.]QOS39810.1 tRNA (adenosine(37)-N6)-threonylcarbamoyltransfera
MTFHTDSSEETIELGKKIGALLKPGDVIAMTGTLAAGKTTITKGIAEALGVKDNITSPTFCLISEYEGEKMPLYHMDVYRLDGEEDFINLGVEDMLYGNGVCIIEWSEKVQKELPKKTIYMTITPDENSGRTITIENWNVEIKK